MENWEPTAFKIDKTVSQSSLFPESRSLPNYGGELALAFGDYSGVDLSDTSIYFKAPGEYLRNQIFSYGGRINYTLTYSAESEEMLQGKTNSPSY